MDKSSLVTSLLYSDAVKREKNQEDDEEEAVTKKAIKELEIFVSQIFYNFFLFISFFSITLLYHFFSILFFYPRHLPTPTTHDI